MKKLIFIISLLATVSYFFFDKSIALYFEHISPLTHMIFKALTTLGYSEYFLVPSGVIFLLFYKSFLPIKDYAKYLFVSVALSGIIVIILKFIFARYRPPIFLKEQLYGFNFFEFGYIVNSFPSGHAATLVGGFSALAFIFPKYKYHLIIFGIIAAFSRVVLDVHYLSDVLIGGLIGYLTSYYLYNYYRAKNEL